MSAVWVVRYDSVIDSAFLDKEKARAEADTFSEQIRVTVTRETLLTPEQAAVIAAAGALHRASAVERISVDDVQAKLAALFAAVEAMPDTLRAQEGA